MPSTPAVTSPVPGTTDEELLCCLGPGYPDFADSDPDRVARIREEVAYGFAALAGVEYAVSIFGSARTPADDPHYILARAVAARVGALGFDIITGGGPGIMEAANRGAREAAVRSIGLNIELPREQTVNPFLDLSLRFRYFFVRKLMFIRYASAFVVFPGGFGTLDELFEALTLIQTGKIRHFPSCWPAPGTGAAWRPGSVPGCSRKEWSPRRTSSCSRSPTIPTRSPPSSPRGAAASFRPTGLHHPESPRDTHHLPVRAVVQMSGARKCA